MRSLALCSLTKNICRPALPDGNPEVWFPLCIFFYDSRVNFAGKINGVFELYLKKHFNVLGFGEVTKEKVRGHRKIFDNLPVLSPFRECLATESSDLQPTSAPLTCTVASTDELALGMITAHLASGERPQVHIKEAPKIRSRHG